MNYILKKNSRNYDATEALQGLISSLYIYIYIYIYLIAHGSTHDLKVFYQTFGYTRLSFLGKVSLMLLYLHREERKHLSSQFTRHRISWQLA